MPLDPAQIDLWGYVDELRELGLGAGLDAVGIAGAEKFEGTRVVLEERKAAGLHGGMQFTYRNPARSTDPERSLPGVQRLIVGAYAYPTEVEPPGEALSLKGPLARVARYATRNHYGVLRDALDAIAERLLSDGFSASVVLDDNALVDRAAAVRAGLGWYGKSANVLLEGAGSWFIFGSVLTDAPLPRNTEEVADGCAGCSRCIDGCPTGAILAAGVVDARRCLAWLVQAEGVFPTEYRIALGDRLYGCDVCQEVCPPSNRTSQGKAEPVSGGDPWVAVLDLLNSTDAELLGRFGRWYIPNREPRYLRRNALIVLGNTATIPIDAEVGHALEAALDNGDWLVRAHAVWAVKRLGAAGLITDRPTLRNDPHSAIQIELAADVSARAGSSS